MYLKLFQNNTQVPIDDILLIYRIFFLLLNKKEISELAQNISFWEASCAFFLNNNSDLEEIKIGKK